jgi:hypothetical protein
MQSRLLCFFSSAGCCSLISTLAWAQEPPAAASPGATDPAAESPASVPSPTVPPEQLETAPEGPAANPNAIVLFAEAPGPPAARRYHYHDSFYLRVNAGYITTWGDFKVRESGYDPDYAGNGLAIDLLVGGSPSPGVAIGGALSGSYVLTSDSGPEPFDPDIQVLVVGPFIDGFPNPAGGWHFGGNIGLATVLAHDPRIANSLLGVGGSAWAGYDAWVAPDWAVGGLLRLGATVASSTSGVETAARGMYLAVYFSALYN